MHHKKLIAPRDGGVITEEIFSDFHDFELLSRAALMLRKKVLLIAKQTLPKNWKVSDIIAGECEIPKDLADFMRNLICGIDSRKKSSECARKVDSISQDIIYAIHNGRMKTSKHMTLGLILKSITSSRKVVDLMNKFGHCCSYNVVEELESEVMSSACNAFNVSPEDAILAPNYCTGVAFDNFDRFVETTSGKDTLHDTVGIFYQNISEIDSSALNESRDSINSLEYQSAAKRRRSLDPIVPELQQYTKIINFTSCNKRQKITINHKVQEVRMQRDLFGRMLGISMEEATDIEKMFSFPMTPMPISLCHLDGTICRTEKSAMMKILRNDSALPTHIDVVIVDGFFLIHSMKDVPKLFGNISKKILQILTSYNASCVHIVFDRYCSPSIKDYERSLRGGFSSNHEYVISGPEQARTHDFAKELRNDKFKEALVLFLISHWQSNDVAPFIGNKTILLNFIDCYSYSVNVNGNVVRAQNPDFCCASHEEADTKIVYHASKINSDYNVVIKCSDTDILVIMLGNLHKITAKIYIKCGVSSSRHVIDVNALHELLGLDLCKALPGFHAFTGCDYNPAFFRKGKQRPFKLLAKKEEFQKAFASLGDMSIDMDDTFAKIESFVCSMYGYEANKKIDNVRFQMFLRNYKIKNTDKVFLKKNLKNFDASCLPPCYTELLQQMRRAHYIAHLWNNATLSDPIKFEPDTSGWTCTENKYDFLWFEGLQLPSSVKDVILDNEDSEVDDEESEYDSDEDPESEENVQDTEYETD